MKSYRTAAVVDDEREIHLRGVPFHPGEEVEVVLQTRQSERGSETGYPLRGLPVRYEEPFEPVAAEEWEAAR